MPSLYSVVVKLSKPFTWIEWVVHDSPAIRIRLLKVFPSFLVCLRTLVRSARPAAGLAWAPACDASAHRAPGTHAARAPRSAAGWLSARALAWRQVAYRQS